MIKPDPDAVGFAIFISFMAGLLAGSMCTLSYCSPSDWHKEAIQRGVAQHNPVTGAWEWTVPVVKEKP